MGLMPAIRHARCPAGVARPPASLLSAVYALGLAWLPTPRAWPTRRHSPRSAGPGATRWVMRAKGLMLVGPDPADHHWLVAEAVNCPGAWSPTSRGPPYEHAPEAEKASRSTSPAAVPSTPPGGRRPACGRAHTRELLRWTWRQVTTRCAPPGAAAAPARPGGDPRLIIPQEGVDPRPRTATDHPKLDAGPRSPAWFSAHDSPLVLGDPPLRDAVPGGLHPAACIVPLYWRGLRAPASAAPCNLGLGCPTMSA